MSSVAGPGLSAPRPVSAWLVDQHARVPGRHRLGAAGHQHTPPVPAGVGPAGVDPPVLGVPHDRRRAEPTRGHSSGHRRSSFMRAPVVVQRRRPSCSLPPMWVPSTHCQCVATPRRLLSTSRSGRGTRRRPHPTRPDPIGQHPQLTEPDRCRARPGVNARTALFPQGVNAWTREGQHDARKATGQRRESARLTARTAACACSGSLIRRLFE
jgi:hypothetical protein